MEHVRLEEAPLPRVAAVDWVVKEGRGREVEGKGGREEGVHAARGEGYDADVGGGLGEGRFEEGEEAVC